MDDIVIFKIFDIFHDKIVVVTCHFPKSAIGFA